MSIPGEPWPAIITFIITLVATAPFLWALSIRKMHSLAYRNLWLDKKYNHGPLVMLEVVRNVLLVVLVGFMVDRLFNTLIQSKASGIIFEVNWLKSHACRLLN